MEVELKFQVPPASCAALRRAVATSTAQRTRLQAVYADTADDRLAAAGLALRLRKEGRQWVQTLKGRGDGLMQRLEHEVPLSPQRGEPQLDPARHAGTAVGELLLRVLSGGGASTGATPAPVLAPLYRTDIQRLHRTLRHGGARIELALDEGWLIAGDQRLPVFEIEFELKAGSPAALLMLAQRWVQRFGLVWDVRTKSERGFRLARGLVQVPAVRAPAVRWPAPPRRRRKGAGGDKAGARGGMAPALTPARAWSALLLSALKQVLPNAAELADEPPAAGAARAPADPGVARVRAEQLHQLRVGLRRLRTVLGLCADWGPDPAAAHALQVAWREPFARLGAARDSDVFGGGLWPEIQAAGGPAVPPAVVLGTPADEAVPGDGAPGTAAPAEPAAVLRSPAFSTLLLQSLALSLPPQDEGLAAPQPDRLPASPAALPRPAPMAAAPGLPAAAAQVLRRGWRQVRRDAEGFATLAVAQQHRTRRRLKRLRYLLEGLLALPGDLGWPRSALRQWHRRLCSALDALGRYNDLCMADDAVVAVTGATANAAAEPAAWFARGWLSVQRPLAMAAAAQRLQRLVDTPAPWPKRRH